MKLLDLISKMGLEYPVKIKDVDRNMIFKGSPKELVPELLEYKVANWEFLCACQNEEHSPLLQIWITNKEKGTTK